MPFDHGIKTGGGAWTFTVRNTIIYDGDNDGIYLNNALDDVTVENCSFLDVDNGIRNNGTLTVTNTISMANVTSFNNSGTMDGSNNMSNLGPAPGPGSLPGRAAVNQYVSIALGSEDLHLKSTSEAIDAGTDPLAGFTDDIDDQVRTGSWEMGADEFGAVPCCSLSVSETGSTVTVTGARHVRDAFQRGHGRWC